MEPLWQHQEDEVLNHTWEPGWFLYWDPRTGKSRPIVIEIAHWVKSGVRRILLVAPLDACKVWLKPSELGQLNPEKISVLNLADSDVSMAERAAALEMLREVTTLPVVVVVNRDVIFKARATHDGTRSLTGLQKALQNWGPQALILDECHDYRKISSQRTRAAETLARTAIYRRGLSGTPDPKDYVDYYAQFKIICPEIFGTRKKDFLERYCEMSYLFPNKVDSYKNVEELRAKIFSRSTRIRQSDCFDVPPELPDMYIDCPFTKLARELYEELKHDHTADFFGISLNATHQLARLTMLHQLAAGFVRDEHNPEWVFDGKIRAAHRYIEEMMRADKRVVVYHHYRPEGLRLYEECLKLYGKETVGSLHGNTPAKQRSPHPFADRPNMRIFIAQEDTAQVSISLRESDHVLWYSWGPKSDVNYQARQRIFADKRFKAHGLSYTFLRVPNTVDDFMTVAYMTKQDRSRLLLDYGYQIPTKVYEQCITV